MFSEKNWLKCTILHSTYTIDPPHHYYNCSTIHTTLPIDHPSYGRYLLFYSIPSFEPRYAPSPNHIMGDSPFAIAGLALSDWHLWCYFFEYRDGCKHFRRDCSYSQAVVFKGPLNVVSRTPQWLQTDPTHRFPSWWRCPCEIHHVNMTSIKLMSVSPTEALPKTINRWYSSRWTCHCEIRFLIQ